MTHIFNLYMFLSLSKKKLNLKVSEVFHVANQTT